MSLVKHIREWMTSRGVHIPGRNSNTVEVEELGYTYRMTKKEFENFVCLRVEFEKMCSGLISTRCSGCNLQLTTHIPSITGFLSDSWEGLKDETTVDKLFNLPVLR